MSGSASHKYSSAMQTTQMQRPMGQVPGGTSRLPGNGGGAIPARTPTPLTNVRFLTVAEVARLMRVSKMTVYRLVHSGDLTAVRVGRSFRVPESAVHTYLNEALSH